ncbi:hypothetical protein DRQ20_00610, partial [bacterium]
MWVFEVKLRIEKDGKLTRRYFLGEEEKFVFSDSLWEGGKINDLTKEYYNALRRGEDPKGIRSELGVLIYKLLFPLPALHRLFMDYFNDCGSGNFLFLVDIEEENELLIKIPYELAGWGSLNIDNLEEELYPNAFYGVYPGIPIEKKRYRSFPDRSLSCDTSMVFARRSHNRDVNLVEVEKLRILILRSSEGVPYDAREIGIFKNIEQAVEERIEKIEEKEI